MRMRGCETGGRRRGSVALVIVILLGLVMAMSLGNGRVLGGLQAELRLLERRQQLRWERLGATNSAGAEVPVPAAGTTRP